MFLEEFMRDLLPDSLFDEIMGDYSSTLTDDMILQSVSNASDFFHIDEPFGVAESDTIGVYPLNPHTLNDDILVFNYDQFMEMGISAQDGVDMVMTHEMAHRALQGMDTGFDSHQEELCCDFFAGVRAGLNGMDVGQFENALANTQACDTHPGGAERVEAIEAGMEFAHNYMVEYGVAPTFDECMGHFNAVEVHELKGFTSKEQITLRQELSASDMDWYASHPSFGCTRH